MKISKTKIANLIRGAMLDSRFSGMNQDVLDSIFRLTQTFKTDEYQNERRELLEKLRTKQKLINERKQKLQNPELLNSLLDYLRLLIESNKATLEVIAKTLEMNSTKLDSFLSSRVNIMTIDPTLLGTLCHSFGLSLTAAKSLIEKTVKLPIMSTLQVGEMGRYAYNGDKANKDKSMNSGAQELLLKASKKRPLKVDSPVMESEEFKTYWSKFETAYKNG